MVTPSGPRIAGRVGSVVIGFGVLLSACSGAGTPAPPASTGPIASSLASATPGAGSSNPAPNPSVASGTPAPATFALSTSGDANVTGTWSSSFGISCLNPTFSGPDIIFFGASPDAKAVVLVTLTTGSILVSERAGSGAGFTDREFQGTGVTSFDPAKGAAFDADLRIVPSPGQKPGTLGTIKHVTGSVDCAGQTAGMSTIVMSGASLEGTFDGPFSQFRVGCNVSAQFGNSVSVTAIANAGSTPTGMSITLEPTGSAIFSYLAGLATEHAYGIAPTGAVSLSPGGANVDADFIERLPAGTTGTPHTIHLSGDVTCGSTKGS